MTLGSAAFLLFAGAAFPGGLSGRPLCLCGPSDCGRASAAPAGVPLRHRPVVEPVHAHDDILHVFRNDKWQPVRPRYSDAPRLCVVPQFHAECFAQCWRRSLSAGWFAARRLPPQLPNRDRARMPPLSRDPRGPHRTSCGEFLPAQRLAFARLLRAQLISSPEILGAATYPNRHLDQARRRPRSCRPSRPPLL